MFLSKNILFLLTVSGFVFGETALVDTFKKCSVADNECLKGVYQSVIHTMAEQGAPELGINKLDPLELNDVPVSLLGLLNMTLLEGKIEGVKTCVLKNFINDIQEGKSTLHVLCDKIVILGNYEVEMIGTLLKTLKIGAGGDVHGKGNGKIVLDKVEILIEVLYHMEKQDDGVHFKLETGDTQNTFNVLEKASFDADNLVIGGKESSKEIINFMNNEWKLILETFGKTFFDKAIEYLQIYLNKFFDGVAAQQFINEDLSSYVKQ